MSENTYFRHAEVWLSMNGLPTMFASSLSAEFALVAGNEARESRRSAQYRADEFDKIGAKYSADAKDNRRRMVELTAFHEVQS